jgi:hypothetical protein
LLPAAQKNAELAARLQPLYEQYLSRRMGQLQSDDRRAMVDTRERDNAAQFHQAAILADLMGRSSGVAEGTRQGAQQQAAFAAADRTSRYADQLYSPQYDQQRTAELLGLISGAANASPAMDQLKTLQAITTATPIVQVPGSPGTPGLLDFGLQAAATAGGLGWAPFAKKAVTAATGGGK